MLSYEYSTLLWYTEKISDDFGGNCNQPNQGNAKDALFPFSVSCYSPGDVEARFTRSCPEMDQN